MHTFEYSEVTNAIVDKYGNWQQFLPKHLNYFICLHSYLKSKGIEKGLGITFTCDSIYDVSPSRMAKVHLTELARELKYIEDILNSKPNIDPPKDLVEKYKFYVKYDFYNGKVVNIDSHYNSLLNYYETMRFFITDNPSIIAPEYYYEHMQGETIQVYKLDQVKQANSYQKAIVIENISSSALNKYIIDELEIFRQTGEIEKLVVKLGQAYAEFEYDYYLITLVIKFLILR